MPEGEVTPIHPWPIAQVATVVVKGDEGTVLRTEQDVEIIIVPWGDMDIEIDKDDFQNGAIVLNECPCPPTGDTIYTTQNERFKLTISATDSETVHVVFNSGWPSGEIVLWKKDKQPV